MRFHLVFALLLVGACDRSHATTACPVELENDFDGMVERGAGSVELLVAQMEIQTITDCEGIRLTLDSVAGRIMTWKDSTDWARRSVRYEPVSPECSKSLNHRFRDRALVFDAKYGWRIDRWIKNIPQRCRKHPGVQKVLEQANHELEKLRVGIGA